MDIIIEILNGILPEIVAGIIGFAIARYTNYSNTPLDKLEISYNRLYYPILCLTRNNNDVLQIVEKSEKYFLKYNKYVDRSTRKAFELLKKNLEDKDAYLTYVSNISEMNRRLRRRLGYLEPNVLTMYTYAAPHEQFVLRLLCELLVIHVFVTIYATIDYESIKTIMLAFSVFFIIIFITDIIMTLCGIMWKKVMKKIRDKQKRK